MYTCLIVVAFVYQLSFFVYAVRFVCIVTFPCRIKYIYKYWYSHLSVRVIVYSLLFIIRNIRRFVYPLKAEGGFLSVESRLRGFDSDMRQIIRKNLAIRTSLAFSRVIFNADSEKHGFSPGFQTKKWKKLIFWNLGSDALP